MPLCKATLTLLIQEKNLYYLFGTNNVFDKAGLMTLFHTKSVAFKPSRRFTKNNNRSLFANYNSENYAENVRLGNILQFKCHIMTHFNQQ